MAENTILEKVYDPRAVEPDMYALWEQSGAFVSKPADTPHDKTFTIVIPPPNVTGALHLGHALNGTLQDILVRYHRMCGFNTLWQPGTDHAGIATQAVVERRIRELEGKSRHDLGREELVRRIWEWKDEYEKRIVGQLKLMGCSCDWSRLRFTLDDGLVKAVRHQFFNLFKDGLIFRGKRLVNWDTDLQTAVANDEVYYETVKGKFWQFKYPVIDPQPGEPDHVVIATTRPETMLGDSAVAVCPDPAGELDRQEAKLREGLDKASDKDRSGIEKKLDAIAERRQTHLDKLITLAAMAKDGRKVLLPLVEREIPLLADEWANPLLGTGCVKITPAHDPNDYEVGLRHDLPMLNVLSPDGKIVPEIPQDFSDNGWASQRYGGLDFIGAGREQVVADLDERGLLGDVIDHDHEQGYSDRSKTPIEPYLSDQWFVKTGDVAPEPQASACAPPEPQASACAKRPPTGMPPPSATPQPRSPDLAYGATLLTWTTYGSWLPGDDRGSVSRAPRADGTHALHNLPGEPCDPDEPHRQAAAAGRMEGKPVRLSREHSTRLLSCIAETCERHGVELLAVAIMVNHVHVLCQGEQHGAELLQLVKGNASRHLNEEFPLPDSPRWWTKSGSRRRIKAGSDLTAAIEYVQNQEYPLLLWSFDVDTGEAARIVEQARRSAGTTSSEIGVVPGHESFAQAEACGSGGIQLGDGSMASGLAQAAIDAVNDGRVAIFPNRYAKSYLDWLGEKRDWCISRQLWWGHRIAVWRMEINPAHHVKLGDSDAASLARHHAEVRAKIEGALRAAGVEGAIWINKTKSLEDGKAPWYVCHEDPRADEFWAAVAPVLTGMRQANKELFSEARSTLSGGFGDMALQQTTRLQSDVQSCTQDPDVLDTWFSSALWPLSTLGWPEKTDHVKQYYPGSVLITSRDIITNWVARMVMFGLYATGEVPFDHVFIHPKILDGRGETMSKSKGNGVDPVDIIHTHGADALRYAMADMCSETQDIRMPVEYICPHCGKLTDQALAIKAEAQARKSRGEKLERKLQPADCSVVKCANKECAKPFATRWAEPEARGDLPVARETSDKFDIGRNFCNKLWNAARFAFLNLEGTTCENIDLSKLPPEDRWILARLSQTIRRYHRCLARYQFAASIKELRDFFWECLCDWYIELTKPRLSTQPTSPTNSTEDPARPEPQAELVPTQSGACAKPATSGTDPARQILAFCIDQVLRLFHPTIPFITERLWSQLNSVAPQRGLPGLADLATDTPLILAEFPPIDGHTKLDDADILATFAALQEATGGVRELRSTAGISPKEKVNVTIALPLDRAAAFEAQAHIVKHMAGIGELTIDPNAKRPANAGSIAVNELRIYVHDISDDEAERKRATKDLDRLEKQISGKEGKLGNEKFVANAKPEVVEAERSRLAELHAQRTSLQAHLAELGG